MKNQSVLTVAILAAVAATGVQAQQVDERGAHPVHQLPPGASVELNPPLIPHDWNQRTGKFEPRKRTNYERGTGANHTDQISQYEQFTSATKSNGSDCRNGGGNQDSTCAQFVIGGFEEPIERIRINDRTAIERRTRLANQACPIRSGESAISGDQTWRISEQRTVTEFMTTSGTWHTRYGNWSETGRTIETDNCVYGETPPPPPVIGGEKACITSAEAPVFIRVQVRNIENAKGLVGGEDNSNSFLSYGYADVTAFGHWPSPADGYVLRGLSSPRNTHLSRGFKNLWCARGMTDQEVSKYITDFSLSDNEKLWMYDLQLVNESGAATWSGSKIEEMSDATPPQKMIDDTLPLLEWRIENGMNWLQTGCLATGGKWFRQLSGGRWFLGGLLKPPMIINSDGSFTRDYLFARSNVGEIDCPRDESGNMP